VVDRAGGAHRLAHTTIIVEFAVGVFLTLATIAVLVREWRRSRRVT